VYLAASSECFSQLDLQSTLSRLVDLEYTNIEIAIRESGRHLKPSQVLEDPEACLHACRQTQRLTPVAFSVDIEAPEELYYEQFTACCKLAKATKVVSITVPAAELGTPFNAEIERLRELVRIASLEQVLVSVKTEVGRVTEDPATAVVLCDNVKGLGITLDPSHYICGPHSGANYDPLLKYTYHVQLRDTKKDALQVRVGQGEIEYGRLVSQLSKVGYERALTVDISDGANEQAGVEHAPELRKMRLLIESLL